MTKQAEKARAPRNRTLTLAESEIGGLKKRLISDPPAGG